MPQIRQYDSPVETLTPRSEGATAMAYLGNAQARAGSNVGQSVEEGIRAVGEQVVNYADQRNISQLTADYSTTLAALTKQWNEIASTGDPNDPTLGANFLEKTVAPALDKFRARAWTERGRQWAESRSLSLNDHFVATTTADMSTLAGVAAKTNATRTLNMFTSVAANDPNALDFLLKNWNAITLELANNPNMKPEVRAAIKATLDQAGSEGLVKAAVEALLMKDPEAGLALAKNPKYSKFFGGDDLVTATKAAEVVRKTQETEKRLAESNRLQMEKDAAETAANKIMTDYVYVDDATGEVRVKNGALQATLDLAKMPNAPPGLVNSTRLAIQKIIDDNAAGRKRTDDPSTLDDFRERIVLDPNDPKFLTIEEVNAANINGLLSAKTYMDFRRTLKDYQSDPVKRANQKDLNSFFIGVRGLITKSGLLSGNDPIGDKYFDDFKRAATEAYAWHMRETAQGRKGLTHEELLSKGGVLERLAAQYSAEAAANSGLPTIINRSQGGGLPVPPAVVPAPGLTGRPPVVAPPSNSPNANPAPGPTGKTNNDRLPSYIPGESMSDYAKRIRESR